MIADIIYLIAGLVLLIVGANYMTDGAVDVARRFKVSNLVIGLTVVALGSSMPDIAVCVASSLEHKTAISVGGVVGANIFDLLLVIGVMGLIRPWSISEVMRRQDIPILFISSVALWVAGDTVLFDGLHHNIIDRSSGIMLLIVFAFYMWFMLSASKVTPGVQPSSVSPTVTPDAQNSATASKMTGSSSKEVKGIADSHKMKAEIAALKSEINTLRSKRWFSWLLIVGGLGALVVGGNWVVDGASGIALKAGMSQGMVALTVVAIGNSLPDLVTSLTATLKGASGLALGNIVGACVINSLFAIGVSSVITPLGADTIGFVDFMTLAGASLLLWIFPLLSKNHRINKAEGILLILLYGAYMAFTIIRG